MQGRVIAYWSTQTILNVLGCSVKSPRTRLVEVEYF